MQEQILAFSVMRTQVIQVDDLLGIKSISMCCLRKLSKVRYLFLSAGMLVVMEIGFEILQAIAS